MENTITDIVCPKCNSIDTDIFNTDEVEFEPSGIGHYYVDVHCRHCGNNFRAYYDFKYEITRQYFM